ncbi:tRNA (adenosine(37)-N6)-threonylcarbamoyltransferase complex transferase subunit TsaD [bacterium]|nr:tRNA (adenosine(37)-N6)-threonylcarbamoyltransferase complex transferase subunit TsaD [bacterium]
MSNYERVAPYQPKYIMGLESSCDETSVAILANGNEVLANLVSTQIPLHAKYGGVVPEVACRAHMEVINPLIAEALEKAQIGFNDLEAVAVTCGPGLVGAVLLGVAVAKTLAGCLNIPLIGVNHMEGHIYSALLENRDIEFPMICLLVSGGHTMLYKVDGLGLYTLLGSTRDDAAGEAFDKVSKALGLGYPGGPKIQALAEHGNKKAIRFSRPMLNDGYDFSFSGLKTAVVLHLQSAERGSDADICASFQEAVVDVLSKKALRAVSQYQAKSLALAGGVSANRALRERLHQGAKRLGITFACPSLDLCTDNAVMIAKAGWELANRGLRSPLSLDAKPNLELV